MGSISMNFPTPAVSLSTHPATLPEAQIPDDTDAEVIATENLPQLLSLTPDNLTGNAIWRDSLALTGTFRTFYGPDLVAHTWQHLVKSITIKRLSVTPGVSQVLRFGPKACWLQASFSFESGGEFPARCSGSLGLVPHEGSWKIWLITTILEQPLGFFNVDKLEPETPDAGSPDCLDCIVVGAGVAGLGMAGRLKSMGLSYTVIEQHDAVGDIWTKARYDSVKLHTSRDFNQLPGLPRTFSPEDPYHLNSHDLAAGFQRYVKTFGINVTTSTTVESAAFDNTHKTWKVIARRGKETLHLSARHIILATGSMGANPITPNYRNRDAYRGETLHALNWRNAKSWHGKRGIVIGSANSAHDIIADMAAASFSSITMVQRSKTWVLPTSTFSALVDPVFNTETPTEVSDRILLGYPLPVQRLIGMEGIRACADMKPEYFERLEERGMNVEWYGDLWGTIYDREGGHFFDVGSGELIADGRVKVISDAMPVEWTEKGLMFDDGREVEADVVVFATGYKSDLRDSARRIVGSGIADGLEDFFQCDGEGETRGAWRDTGHPALWYTGHGYAHARYYSRFLAMRIKADVEGRPMPQFLDNL